LAHQHDIIRLHDVTVRFGNHVALDRISANLVCGSHTAVLGPNGAGKSTLLRAILGWMPLARGEIRIGDSHPHHALPRLAYLPQRLEIDWDFPITVREVVRQGRYPALGQFRRFGRDDNERVAAAIDEMGLGEICDRQIRALSGGQQQRVFLARALAQGADIFLLDEPFSSLDPAASEELGARLKSWEGQGRTVIAVLHDVELAKRVFPSTLLLNTRLVANGATCDVLSAGWSGALAAAANGTGMES
jgi:ABC-type Mn2+/Zn2+ transport system ATPase subunit